MGIQADFREAAVALLQSVATSAQINLSVYPARPRTLAPPHAFIDSMADELSPFPGSSTIFQHVPLIEVIVVWGIFDSLEAVTQRDAFVDAFHDTVRAAPHQAGGASLIAPRSVGDIPLFIPDWMDEQEQRPYFATRIVLGGDRTD